LNFLKLDNLFIPLSKGVLRDHINNSS